MENNRKNLVEKSFVCFKNSERAGKTLNRDNLSQGLNVKELEQDLVGRFSFSSMFHGKGSKDATYPSIRSIINKLNIPETRFINSAVSSYSRYLKNEGLDKVTLEKVVVEPVQVAGSQVAGSQVAGSQVAGNSSQVTDASESPERIIPENFQIILAQLESLENSLPANVSKEWKSDFHSMAASIRQAIA